MLPIYFIKINGKRSAKFAGFNNFHIEVEARRDLANPPAMQNFVQRTIKYYAYYHRINQFGWTNT